VEGSAKKGTGEAAGNTKPLSGGGGGVSNTDLIRAPFPTQNQQEGPGGQRDSKKKGKEGWKLIRIRLV